MGIENTYLEEFEEEHKISDNEQNEQIESKEDKIDIKLAHTQFNQ